MKHALHSLTERLVRGLLRRDLRAAFRRVCWIGPPLTLPPRTPAVLYANHHHYYDGHLLWLLVTGMLRRPGTLWMADWDRFPFFGAVGAQPFPPEDARRRGATLRRTARRFREQPGAALAYFPEGGLHAPEEGLLPFPEGAFTRLDRLLPEKLWCPIAVHVTWWGEARPTALLTGGAPHAVACGDEHERLREMWGRLRSQRPGQYAVLLEGRPAAAETWDFSFARPFFKRYL